MERIIELNEALRQTGEGSTSQDNAVRIRSINRLPERVTRRLKEDYEPLMVSIGPYHNGKEQTKVMEKNKVQALRHFLDDANISLESYYSGLEGIVDELRDAYDDLDDEWKQDTSKFLIMMMLDGCFIVETLRGNLKRICQYDDRVYDTDRLSVVSKSVRTDMLLIENQVPLQLLEKIFPYVEPNFEHEDVLNVILKFCSPDKPSINDGQHLHILDLYRKSLVSKLVHTADTQSSRSGPYSYKCLQVSRYIPPFLPKFFWCLSKRKKEKDRFRHSATEMKKARVNFKCITEEDQIISFEGTTLWLPKLFLDDGSYSTFFNIMALEKFHENTGNEWTTYIFFMYKLIKSDSDVKLLEEEEIIHNSMDTEKEVVQLFHELCREYTLYQLDTLDESHWYVVTSENIDNYYSSCICTLRKWKYNLMSTYFKSPGTLIAFLAATFLLCLTATQTVYAILSYVNR